MLVILQLQAYFNCTKINCIGLDCHIAVKVCFLNLIFGLFQVFEMWKLGKHGKERVRCQPSVIFVLNFIFLVNSGHGYEYQLTPTTTEAKAISASDTLNLRDETGNGYFESFWSSYAGHEHVTQLSSEDFSKFVDSQQNPNPENKKRKDSFVMFYANWCSASKQAAEEFAKVAQEMAYTEGFANLTFGALDCNATHSDKYICNIIFNITKYPRFVYFRQGSYDRMYPSWCPRHTDFFYSWIVNKGGDSYCTDSGTQGVVFVKSSHDSQPPQYYYSSSRSLTTSSLWVFYTSFLITCALSIFSKSSLNLQ